ncbi:hypothetical protein BDV27DRAFT_127393 [Aspergillus caelatus]|uniref:TauD/TfdA-like domain-containing protein n=1 Tax=Aspergillus caelatus TaxID=61420 RepID=A0A5N7A9B9_9EURO|nr:uncharacterized protein BDV27DRAFT_127393 [Aspergillus caelatus]KAE8365180.1 hypothetical protein BDV27DRAFT_127393 [Aspergillus caelatus]
MVRLLATFLRSSRAAVPSARPLYSRGYAVASGAAEDAASLGPNSTTAPEGGQHDPIRSIVETPMPQTRNSQPSAPSIGRQGIRIPTGKGDISALHYLLRDGCKCPQCVDQHSKQRNFRMSDIPTDIKPRSADWDGSVLKVKWENDIPGFDESHTSTYTLNQLRNPSANYSYHSTGRKRKRLLWHNWFKHRFVSYEEYMHDDKAFSSAMRNLAQTGLLFVKDVPDSRAEVEKIATRMGPLRNTFYGSTWDVRTVPEAKNVAYTSQFLGFHMDLMYMNEPPGFQLLHCLQNSCDGGESLFADSFAVARQLGIDDPEAFKALCNLRLSYEYNHENDIYTNDWPVFQTYVDEYTQQQRLTHANYSPPFQAPMHGQRRPFNRTVTEMRALDKFAKMLEDESYIYELKLNPGECVIFENRRVLHARKQFNTATGQRWLAGAYVDEDAVLSKFATSARKYPHMWRDSPNKPYRKEAEGEGQVQSN